MSMVKKILTALSAFVAAFLVFAPWKELYYVAERLLASRHLTIAGESLREIPAGLEISHSRILWRGFPVAEIGDARFRTLLFVSELRAEEILPGEALRRLFPLAPERVVVRHVFWDPARLSLRLSGTFGRAEGEYDLRRRRLRLRLSEPKEIGALRASLKKIDGEWVYERHF